MIWNLVSANPARVAGLNDRGSFDTGCRADLILVDDADPAHPQVVATMVGGKLVYSSGRLRRKPALGKLVVSIKNGDHKDRTK
ncbi:amidohydrolase family protein [Devosia sp.]|uniref:amidohydrolase family protein n=1 Tax=Devosia sp. TaxID=1871048 RepID=UPI003450FCEB